jgi:hypothetical protein
MAEQLALRHRTLQEQLSALDTALKIYDPSLEPSVIEPVNGWKAKFGRRGALKNATLRVLQEAAPEWVATNNLAMVLIAEFGLHFPLYRLYRAWVHGTLVKSLNRLCAEGVVERRQDTVVFGNEEAYWRMKAATAPGTLADL